MDENFDNLVYYAICENLYLQKDKTNYVSFNALCQNMKDCIVNGLPCSTELYKLLDNMMKNIMLLYGFDAEEMAIYLNKFLIGDKWLEYKEMVIILKNNTGNSFQ
jgi:hypothetical protein